MNELLNLNKTKFGFIGTIHMPVWDDFKMRDRDLDRSATCLLHVGGDMMNENPIITEYHEKAYDFLKKNQKEVKNNILNALFKEYENLRISFDFEEEEKKDLMPDVSDISEFKNLISLSTVHLMNVAKDGVGYVGFEFECKWDEEHGLGIMIHRNRIVDIGDADTAFTSWVAEDDL